MTSLEEWAKFERLKDFLKDYELSDILAAASEQAFDQASRIRQAGYPQAAKKVEHLATVLGDTEIPSIPTGRRL